MDAKRWRTHYLNALSECDRAELETYLPAAESAIIGHVIPLDAASEQALLKEALFAFAAFESRVLSHAVRQARFTEVKRRLAPSVRWRTDRNQ
ncbi:MAG TPA: hypothetical protein VNO32_26555 [Candidatus Acidoferrum sp.]|jgi:hypothetical protein|nr:hypothetical protein [Candidatus Acidoferrum sp.]